MSYTLNENGIALTDNSLIEELIMTTIKRCPECSSDKVYSCHVQAFYINTDEHCCHMKKTHDAKSPSGCEECGWSGALEDIINRKARARKIKEELVLAAEQGALSVNASRYILRIMSAINAGNIK